MSLEAVRSPKTPSAAPGKATQGAQATQAARAGLPLLLQRQSVMGRPGDAFEREAESAAEAVQSDGVAAGAGQNNASMHGSIDGGGRGPAHGGSIPLFLRPRQAAGDSGGAPGYASAGHHPALGPGRSLDFDVGGAMEAQLGPGVSAVRVHTDSSTARLADMLGAKAFTTGRDIVFGEHQFQPDTAEGRGLLAHELTHAVQQGYSDGGAPALQLSPVDAPPLAPSAAPVPAGVPALPPVALIPEPFVTPPAPVLPASVPSGTVPQFAAGAQLEAATGAAAAQLSQAAAGGSAEAPVTRPGQGEAAPGRESHGPATAGGKGKKGSVAQAGAAAAGKGGARAARGRGAAEGASEGFGGGEVSFGPGPAQATTGTGVEALGTGELVLIDVELAEHERWAGAMGRVGEAESLQRAEFIAESVGSGFITGAASGLGASLVIGVISRAVPAVGPIIGGVQALHGLATRDWAETEATITGFGEGNDTYDKLAHSIASIATVIDVISQVLTYIDGIVGVVEAAAAVIAGGAIIGAIFTFGATLGIAAVAGDVVAACQEISEGLGVVTGILNEVNAAVLKPTEALFRALHEYTTKADPREVEAQGHTLSAAAAASGAALGAWAGGKAAHMGAKPHPPAEANMPTPKAPHETPPPAAGEGPVVRFKEPAVPVGGEGAPAVAAGEPGVPGTTGVTMRRVTDDQVAAPASPAPTPAEPEQLPLPGVDMSPTPALVSETVPTAPAATGAASTEPTTATALSTPGTPNEASFAELNSAAQELANSPLGDRIAAAAQAGPPPLDTAPGLTKKQAHDRAYSQSQANPPEGTPTPTSEIQHWAKVKAGTTNLPAGTDPLSPEAINANRSWLQTGTEAPAHTLLTDPEGGGTRYYVGERPYGGANDPRFRGEAEVPGQQLTIPGMEVPTPDKSYRTEHRFADRYLEPTIEKQIAAGRAAQGLPPLDPRVMAQTVGEQARWMMEGTPGTNSSGTTIDLGRTGPQQLLLAPEILTPGMQPRGATVAPLPRASAPLAPTEQLSLPMPGIDQPAPNQGQGASSFDPAVLRHVGEAGGGPTRGAEPLTDEQYQQAVQMAVQMGMPADQIARISGPTAHLGGAMDMLLVGPDLNALPESERPQGLANPANAALDPRAVIGHEVIGHREAALGGQTRDEDWHEELQASARAALHTPELSPEQRWLLLQDSASRRRFQKGEGEIYVDTERYGAAAEADKPSGGPPRGPNDEPSVIIDYDALNTAPTAATPGVTPAARNAAAAAAPAPNAGTAPPSTAQQAGALFLPDLFGPSGEAPTYAQQQAAHRSLFTDDNQPAEGVERANPNYPPPPATPAQIDRIQNEIMNLLTMRATAEQEADRQEGRADQCRENQAPIEQTVRDTHGGISAVEAHDQAVARRQEVNQKQQQRHQESQELVTGYPSKVAGITALTVPLSAWENFTSLASHLPGEAGDKMLEMNHDAQQMEAGFDQMAAQMMGVGSGGPAREAGLTSDAGRLEATDRQAKTSDKQLHTASEGAAQLRRANFATQAEAVRVQQAATGRAKECTDAIEQRQEHATTLTQQLQEWAQAHKAARDAAIAATEERLKEKGYTVLPREEQ